MPKRKTSETPTRIMKFGCLPPDVGAAEFDEQLRLAHRYRNKLVEIERARRARFREIRLKHCPGLGEIEAEVASLTEQIDQGYERARQVKHWERRVAEILRDNSEADLGDLPERIAKGQAAAAELPVLKEKRKALNQSATEQRKAYEVLLRGPREAYKARAKELAAGGATHVKARANAQTLEQMLTEPEWPAAWKESVQADVLYADMVKTARKQSGVAPGTYLMIDAAMEASKRDAESEIRFVRFTGEGRIAVQLRDTSTDDVRAGDSTFLRLAPGPKPTKPGAKYKPDEYQRVSIRVGSVGRTPIWTELPVWIHRPIPKGEVKWAWILVRRQGPRLVYQLQLTIETEERLRPERRGSGTVAVNFGWCQTVKGLRVGYAVGSDGFEQSIEADPKSLQLFAFCDSLRSIADRHFDETRAAITAWRGEGHAEPEWLAEAVLFMSHWQWHGKLVRLAERWRDEALGSDRSTAIWRKWFEARRSRKLDLFCGYAEFSDWLSRDAEYWELEESARFAMWLELWRQKDTHLWAWEANERKHAIRRRDQAYRLAAIRLAERYEFFVYDTTDFSKLALREPEEWEAREDTGPTARHQRMVASPSEFRTDLLDVFEARVIKVDKNRASMDHAGCGGSLVGDSTLLTRSCTKCGALVDRDANNCRNLLLRAGAPSEPAASARAGAR